MLSRRRPRDCQVASPYIERILKARVYDVAIESPLEEAARLSRRLGNRVLLKREDLQPVFSFKLRGAYNRIAHLSEASARRSEEHTSELQSQSNLVCRLLLEKKKRGRAHNELLIAFLRGP